MKDFKVQKTDLFFDGEYYNENEVYEFDEKNKHVKKLVSDGILLPAKAEEVKAKDKLVMPTIQDKKEVILAFMDEHDVSYEEADTKEVLIGKIDEWYLKSLSKE